MNLLQIYDMIGISLLFFNVWTLLITHVCSYFNTIKLTQRKKIEKLTSLQVADAGAAAMYVTCSIVTQGPLRIQQEWQS